MDLEGGRNALVLLARALAGRVAPSGAADLLAFAARAGGDLHGAGLGLAAASPEWRWDVNVATLKPDPSGRLVLTVNIRGGPGLVGDALARHLARQVGDFAERTGARLEVGPGYFADAPLAFDPESRIVRRLLAAYRRGAGRDDPPSVSPGGTYAKRIPRAIAFGMWFPDRTYPGHAADESVPIADLHRGVDVLLEALVDLACSPPIPDPFAR
jgi:succinyl-diaminopimelate desuccinylase